MEVLEVTTIFVHDNDKTQTIHCSDGSQGVMTVSEESSAPYYNFKFYSHEHPGFWVDQDQFHDGESVTVQDIQSDDQFQLKFVWKDAKGKVGKSIS